VSYEDRCRELGVEFPTLPVTAARIVPAVRVDRVVYASGQTPHRDGSLVFTGKLGRDVEVESGRRAARLAALNCLTQVRDLLGSLDGVERIARVTGYVASAEGFFEQAAVINGASEFLEEIFGEAGTHARSAIGVAELPGGASVEIELIAVVAPGS
jgi:enamine deaminase RidA (YjgF/YER057c/UK114 family)